MNEAVISTLQRRPIVGNEKMVSVCMITYNHEQHIERAIEGVLRQVVDFEIELVIGEDSSSDKTREICAKYAYTYPGKIRLMPKAQRKGMSRNFLETIQSCTGKYIAFCEGDDYWTDQLKLQMQVDFLEANKHFVLSSTRFKIFNSTTLQYSEDTLSFFFKNNEEGKRFDNSENLWNWISKTLTVVMRNELVKQTDYRPYLYFRDVHLIYHLLTKGFGYCHNVETGVYLQHDGGVWSSKTDEHKLHETFLVLEELVQFNKGDKDLKSKYLNTVSILIDVMIANSSRPLFNSRIYFYIYKYLISLQSWLFLKEKIYSLLKKTLSGKAK